MEQQKFFRFLKKTIREEVRNVIKQELSEILKEGLQTTVNELKEEKLPKKKVVKKSSPKFKKTGFADILNETSELTETNPVGNYASMMNESYNDLSFTSKDAQGFGMMRQSQAPSVMEDPDTGKSMKVDPVVAKAMTRDYSSLMKAIDKKKNK
jgi:hypothetical protein